MIKAVLVTGNKEEICVLGLSRRNVEKLFEGKPIMINLADLGLSEQRIVLLAGETEDDIKEDLRSLAPMEPFQGF